MSRFKESCHITLALTTFYLIWLSRFQVWVHFCLRWAGHFWASPSAFTQWPPSSPSVLPLSSTPRFFTFSPLELHWWISFWHFTSPWIALMDLISFCPFLSLWVGWSLFPRRTQWPAAQAPASQQIQPRTGRRSRFFEGLLRVFYSLRFFETLRVLSFDCD